jgi:hypothetical protein
MAIGYRERGRIRAALGIVLAVLVLSSAVARADEAHCEALLTGNDVKTLAPDVKARLEDAVSKIDAKDEETARRSVGEKVKSALGTLKGGCLRGNPVAMKNFGKVLGTVWTFQVTGWIMANSSKAKDEKADFPFAVLANTAFMIWIQSEMNCANTAPAAEGAPQPKTMKEMWHTYVYGDKQTFKDATHEYLGNVKNRYSSYMVTLPVGIISFTILQTIEDEIRKHVEGEKTKRPDLLSKEHLESVLGDAIYNTAFNMVWLFPRWALATTPLEMRLIPMFHSVAKASGRFAQVGAVGAEWGYRIGMGLLDNWVFFKTRKDGVEIKGFVSFNPNKIAKKIIEPGKPEITEVKNPKAAKQLVLQEAN